MNVLARIAVIGAVVVAPFVVATPSAHACWDAEGRCLVRCVVGLATDGTCQL